MEPQEEKKGWLKTLALLEVGVFEMLFVGGVAALFFIIFNYFNILPISSLYPKLFGFLPHQKESNVSEISTVNKQNTSPTPTPSFNYDTKKAETLLTQYIKDTIKPEFLPAKIEVKQKLIASGKQEGTDYEFGANWTIDKNAFLQSNFHYKLGTNDTRDIEFSVQLQDMQEAVASAILAGNLIGKYLKNIPVSNFDCGIYKDTTSFCENFHSLTDGKRGFGLVIGQNKPNNIVLVFSCFIPKESVYYSKRNSCLLFRENK